VSAEQARDVRRIASELRLEEQFDACGLHVAQPSRPHVSRGSGARPAGGGGRGRRPGRSRSRA
jgi:hypothetical protein